MYVRVKYEAQGVMREAQARFRKNRDSADYIILLRNIFEQCEECRKSVALIFVDFLKAFVSIHRASMWKIVELHRIQRKMINILKNMYDGSESSVRVDQGQMTEFYS